MNATQNLNNWKNAVRRDKQNRNPEKKKPREHEITVTKALTMKWSKQIRETDLP